MGDLLALKAEIEALPAHAQLELAGGLLKRAVDEMDPKRKLMLTRTAHVIASRMATEIGAALALHDLQGGRHG